MAERISAPIGACSFIFSNSAAVSLPGLLRMCSGTAILPVSCSSAAASIALSVGSSVDPDLPRQRHRGHLDAADVAVRDLVLRVDRRRQRFHRRQIQAIERHDVSLGVFVAAERRAFNVA